MQKDTVEQLVIINMLGVSLIPIILLFIAVLIHPLNKIIVLAVVLAVFSIGIILNNIKVPKTWQRLL
jgi:hypothetical protein